MSLYTIATTLRDWAATTEKWKKFWEETGSWPVLSIAASLLHTFGFVFGAGFLIWYSGKHRWTNNHFVLILAAALFPYIFGWNWLRRRIYLGELRRARHEPATCATHERAGAGHHREVTTLPVNVTKSKKGRPAGLMDAAWQIDRGIFIVFIAFVAAGIVAKAIFWIFGW